MSKEQKKEEQGKGIIKGYKPNRISLYILLLNTNRLEELSEVLWKDMEPFKEDEPKPEIIRQGS